MTQDALLLLATAVTAIYATRWALRLAPATSELPVKTGGAALLASLAALALFSGTPVPPLARAAAVVVSAVYAFALPALVGLARARRYGLARRLAAALYWTPAGRAGPARLLAQAALQQGDAEAAVALAPDGDPLLLAQAYAQQQRWAEVLELELPRGADNTALGDAARIEALLAAGRAGEAERELDALRARWHAQGEGPLGYRAVRLSEARLAAERGDLAEVQELLQGPAGIATHVALGVLARAAERAGRPDVELELAARAYAAAPAGARARFAARLERAGRPLPARAAARGPAWGTYALTGAILLAYLGQLALDQAFGPTSAFQIGAFTLGLAVPEAGAPWRYLSYAFLHSGLVHLGFNAWVLLDIGRLYEARRSWGSVVASFALGTWMGAYLTAIAQAGDQLLLVGASGGVLGVAGALLADALRGRGGADRALTRGLLQWMALIALVSVAIPNVSLWGHAGGIVGGLLWGFARQGLPGTRLVDRLGGAAGAALLAVAAASAAALAWRVFA